MKSIGFELENIDRTVGKAPDVLNFVHGVIDNGLIDPKAPNFLKNKDAIFISKPRLRQWRIKPDESCVSPISQVDCLPRLDHYSFLERRSFREGWTNPGYIPKTDNDSDFLEWKYDSAKTMGSYKGM